MRRAGWRERDLVGDTSKHECETRLWLVSASKTALQSHRLLLVTGLMASVVPCLTGHAALFLVIPVAYLMRFAIALFDARARRSALCLARELPIDLPAAMSFSDGTARRLLERLNYARRATQRALLTGPVGPAFDVATLIDRVPQLERDVVVLAARVEYLERFLDSETTAGVIPNGSQFGQGQGGPDGTTPASEQLDRAIARCPEHLDLLAHLTDRMNKASGMAEEVLRTLEQIPAKIVDLQLTRLESCDVRSADACKEAAIIIESFRALERATSGLASAEVALQ